jgi:hypothetical protein
MTRITNLPELRKAIRVLELKQRHEGVLLKEQFKITYESLRPAHLIQNTISELTNLPDFKGNLLNTTLSLAAGYLVKKATVGNSINPLKQLFGILLQMGVTGIVSKKSNSIRSAGSILLKKLFTPAKEI